MSFKKAFASARKAGKKEFKYEGKSFNTKLAPDKPKVVPVPKDKPQSGPGRKPTGPSITTVAKKTQGSDQKAPAESKMAIETGSRARNQEKARKAAQEGTKARVTKKEDKEQQDYPRPAKDVGIARAKSKIGQAAAREENRPKKKK